MALNDEGAGLSIFAQAFDMEFDRLTNEIQHLVARFARRNAPRKVGDIGATLERGILECSQNGIDSRLVPPALCLEPFQYVRIHSKRDRRLRVGGLETLAHDATDDMPHLGLGMFSRHLDLTVLHGTNPCQVSPGGF